MSNASGKQITINKLKTGIVAISCFVGAMIVYLLERDLSNVWFSILLRIGLVMSAIWLALPSKSKPAAWANVSPTTLGIIVVAIVGIGYRPKIALPIIVGVAVIGYFLKPREKKRLCRQERRVAADSTKISNSNSEK